MEEMRMIAFMISVLFSYVAIAPLCFLYTPIYTNQYKVRNYICELHHIFYQPWKSLCKAGKRENQLTRNGILSGKSNTCQFSGSTFPISKFQLCQIIIMISFMNKSAGKSGFQSNLLQGLKIDKKPVEIQF